MDAKQLKSSIHQIVDSVQSDLTLVDIYAAISLIVEQQDIPLDGETSLLQNRLQKAITQIEAGTYITNEQMKQQVRQWLSK